MYKAHLFLTRGSEASVRDHNLGSLTRGKDIVLFALLAIMPLSPAGAGAQNGKSTSRKKRFLVAERYSTPAKSPYFPVTAICESRLRAAGRRNFPSLQHSCISTPAVSGIKPKDIRRGKGRSRTFGGHFSMRNDPHFPFKDFLCPHFEPKSFSLCPSFTATS